MSFAPQPNDKELALTTWGGLVTENDPSKLPEGVSPLCNDFRFIPGSTSTRYCLQKVFANPLYPTATRTYGKSYVSPTGTIFNLYLYSNGIVTVENITSNPDVETVLFASCTTGAYAKSVTAFGREYLAISDGLHGQEVPLQFTAQADGTIQIDRVTQDGPGAPATVASIPLPSVQEAIIPTSGPSITSITTTDLAGSYYTTITVVLTGAPTVPLALGVPVTISGNSNSYFNIHFGGIIQILSTSSFKLTQYSSIFQTGTGGAVSGTGSATMIRSNNVVTVATQQQHNLQVGYQAQITDVPATVIGTAISTIVIDNEQLPGIATVTTQTPHGLLPGNFVSITGVEAVVVGGAIESIQNVAEVVTVIMTGATGLVPGAIVTIAGVATAGFNTGFAIVSNVTTTTNPGDTFSYIQASANAGPDTGGGTVSVNWPIPNTATPTFFEVQSAPTDDSFQVQINYSDTPTGGFTTGSVTFAWDGTFFVKSIVPPVVTAETTLTSAIVSTTATTAAVASGANILDGATIQIGTEQMIVVSGGTTMTLTVSRGANGTTAATHANSAPVSLVIFGFTYQQYGPDDTTIDVGTVTPFGQAAPGIHQLQVMFLTRQDYITAPSPPVQFVANGGQYLSITNIPIGPANVIGRILAFTGASGAFFYYIPTPSIENGQVVSSATQINDNTTTAIVLDFSDNSLFAAIGINEQGNNLPNQIIIEGALGFGFYDTRLLTYGQRNVVDTLLNMTFDGGYLPITVTGPLPYGLPTGWISTLSGGSLRPVGPTAGSVNTSRPLGFCWQIVVAEGTGACGELSQSFYEDYVGGTVGTGNTLYGIRAWLQASVAAADLTFTVSLTSASTSFSATATIAGNLMSTTGSFLAATFSAKTPVTIPADMMLNVYAASSATNLTLLVDELNITYIESPYTDTIINGSYGNNPEAFDGVSGPFGPEEDTHKVMDFGIIRDTLYILTQDPAGRLHETSANGTTEPADWGVEEIAANCGLISAFALTKSQADDSSASGGEEWLAWAASQQARIFGGGEPYKISQEIQPDWDSVNPAAGLRIWALNDPVARIIYFGLPLGSASAPTKIYHVNYRELDSAQAIAGAPPVHVGFSGKLTAHDNSRKWCPWNLAMNGAASMYRAPGQLSTVFFNGNGLTPGTSTVAAYGNAYTLNPTYLTDDDYGQMFPLYLTYFGPAPEVGQALGLNGRSMIAYLMAQISGIGNVKVTAYPDGLSHPWSLTCTRTLAVNPRFDLEWSGANCWGDRIAIGFSVTPATGTNVQLAIKNLRMWLRTHAKMPVRGSAF